MPIRHRLALVSAFWIVALTASAAAQSVPLPREAQIGPRPFYLVDKMKDGPLKTELSQCTGPFRKTDFSIGHRGGALQFPEHSKESYQAAARMGAGVIECDVTFTRDRQLVCRHSQCDLHTTTQRHRWKKQRPVMAGLDPAIHDSLTTANCRASSPASRPSCP
jgi:glycerophosphoryl diester phosphodiesterase